MGFLSFRPSRDISQQYSGYLHATVDYLTVLALPLPFDLYLAFLWHAGGYLPPNQWLESMESVGYGPDGTIGHLLLLLLW